MSEAIELDAPDDAWPAAFAAEKALIAPLFAIAPRLIEHMGSTAVPGLGAKPVIDIIVLMDRLADARPAIPAEPVVAAKAATTRLKLAHAAEQLGGDRELLQQVLERFQQDFASAPAQLHAALEQQQFEPAIRLVHTLKGLAPTLGADALHRLAQQFEQDLQRQDTGLQAAFEQELGALLNEVATALERGDRGERLGTAGQT